MEISAESDFSLQVGQVHSLGGHFSSFSFALFFNFFYCYIKKEKEEKTTGSVR